MRPRTMLKYSVASLMFAVVDCQQKLPNGTVLKSFEKKYPKSKYTTWQHIEGTIWEAAFLWKEKECSALFEESGKWLETCTYLPMGKVPKVVQESYEKAKTSDALVKIFHLETPAGIYYEFQLNKANYAFKMQYDIHGKMVKNSIL